MAGAPRKPSRRATMLHALPFAICSALCFALAFPPFDIAILAPLALIPLVRLAQTSARTRWALVPVLVCFALAFGYHHQWMFAVTTAGTPFLLLYLALYPCVFVAILSKLRGKRISTWTIAPFLWLFLEWFRGSFFATGYPWFLIGHPFGPASAPLLTGFFVALLSCGIGQLISIAPDLARPPGAATSAIAKIAIPLVAALFIPATPRAQQTATLAVAVIQTNVPQDNKIAWNLDQRIADFQRMLDLTHEAAEANPDLIVWPETMFPGYTLSPGALQAARDAGIGDTNYATYCLHFADALVTTQRELGVPLLVGAIGVDDLAFDLTNEQEPWTTGAIYNSVFLISDGQIQPERYDKIHLTPFGEVMPYISAIDWLENALLSIGAAGMTFDLSAGSSRTVFEVPTKSGAAARIVTPICFEATSAGVCRQLVGSGPDKADLMINLTNDGWFANFDAGREHHLLIARWRCTENRTPMLRAANTGVSCKIDRWGTVTDALPPRTEGILHTTIPLYDR